MKFEKFLKRCGTHGQIVKRKNGDKWLICDGVGMLVPEGVVNLLGAGDVGEKTREIVEAIVTADIDDRVQLTDATVPADGGVRDIIRVFRNEFETGSRVRIRNADFGLLERKDVLLAYLEIVDDETEDTEAYYQDFLLVLDPLENVIGFIAGVPES